VGRATMAELSPLIGEVIAVPQMHDAGVSLWSRIAGPLGANSTSGCPPRVPIASPMVPWALPATDPAALDPQCGIQDVTGRSCRRIERSGTERWRRLDIGAATVPRQCSLVGRDSRRLLECGGEVDGIGCSREERATG